MRIDGLLPVHYSLFTYYFCKMHKAWRISPRW